MTWTREREKQLMQLWSEGHVASAIARVMGGLSRCAVIGKAHRMKLEGRARTPGDAARIGNKLRHGQSRSHHVVVSFAPPAAPVPPTKQPARNVRLVDLEPADCRWALGETAGPDTLFCGHPQMEGAPYCAYHQSLARVPLSSSSSIKRATYYAGRAA